MNRRSAVVLSIMGCLIFMLVHTSDLKAPEITERDLYGYEPFHVAESGAIVDTDGVIHGWVSSDGVYDAHWNVRYRVHKGRARVVPEKNQMQQEQK